MQVVAVKIESQIVTQTASGFTAINYLQAGVFYKLAAYRDQRCLKIG